mgnify:CR=1 FL=1
MPHSMQQRMKSQHIATYMHGCNLYQFESSVIGAHFNNVPMDYDHAYAYRAVLVCLRLSSIIGAHFYSVSMAYVYGLRAYSHIVFAPAHVIGYSVLNVSVRNAISYLISPVFIIFTAFTADIFRHLKKFPFLEFLSHHVCTVLSFLGHQIYFR